MKTIALTAMICAATVAGSFANTNSNINKGNEKNKHALSHEQGTINHFKDGIAFHQRNVEVLWDQYELATERIRNSKGNHKELDADKAYFVGVYQDDINKGLRVEDSRKAIAEIEAIYARKHADRDAYEAKAIAKLQAQLKAELAQEKDSFKSLKKEYSHLIDTQTLPLLLEVESSFARSNDLVAKLDHTADNIAIAAL